MQVELWFVQCITVALLLAIVAPAAAQDAGDQERQAIEAVEAAGGRVMTISAQGPQKDVAFHLSSKEITDDQLEPLHRIPHVIWLNLRGTQISDAGLAHVAPLRELSRLHLEKTQISDAGLTHLAALSELEYLNLYGTRITDQGLAQLGQLSKLKRLFIWQTAVTDAGIEALQAQLPELEIIGAATLEKAEPSGDEPPRPAESKAKAGDDKAKAGDDQKKSAGGVSGEFQTTGDTGLPTNSDG